MKNILQKVYAQITLTLFRKVVVGVLIICLSLGGIYKVQAKGDNLNQWLMGIGVIGGLFAFFTWKKGNTNSSGGGYGSENGGYGGGGPSSSESSGITSALRLDPIQVCTKDDDYNIQLASNPLKRAYLALAFRIDTKHLACMDIGWRHWANNYFPAAADNEALSKRFGEVRVVLDSLFAVGTNQKPNEDLEIARSAVNDFMETGKFSSVVTENVTPSIKFSRFLRSIAVKGVPYPDDNLSKGMFLSLQDSTKIIRKADNSLDQKKSEAVGLTRQFFTNDSDDYIANHNYLRIRWDYYINAHKKTSDIIRSSPFDYKYELPIPVTPLTLECNPQKIVVMDTEGNTPSCITARAIVFNHIVDQILKDFADWDATGPRKLLGFKHFLPEAFRKDEYSFIKLNNDYKAEDVSVLASCRSQGAQYEYLNTLMVDYLIRLRKLDLENGVAVSASEKLLRVNVDCDTLNKRGVATEHCKNYFRNFSQALNRVYAAPKDSNKVMCDQYYQYFETLKLIGFKMSEVDPTGESITPQSLGIVTQ